MVKQVAKIFLTLFILVLFSIAPKIAFAVQTPPFVNADCGFTVSAFLSGTKLTNPGPYEVDYSFDKLEYSFDLSKVPPENWTQFPDVWPVNPDGTKGNRNPDVLDDKSDASNPQVDLNWDNWDNVLCRGLADKRISGLDIRSTPSIQVNSIFCNDLYTLNKQYQVKLISKDITGQDFILCSGRYTVTDKAKPGAQIDIISNNQLDDVDSYWDVTIDGVTIPKSWKTDQYLVSLDGKLLYKSRTSVDPRLSRTDNLSNFFTPPPAITDTAAFSAWVVTIEANKKGSPVTFQLTPLKPGTHKISLQSLSYITFLPPSIPELKDITEEVFTVVEKGQPTPTMDPGPPICSDFNRICKRQAKFCNEPCNYCPGCPDYDKWKSGHAYFAPELKQICNQVTTSNGMRDNCLECINNSDPSKRGIWTAIGCIPVSFESIIQKYIFTFGLGIAGGIAFLYFLYGSFLILTSMGNPERIEEAKQIIVSSIAGLLLIIFSITLLSIIGVDILQLPGFGK